MKLYFYGADRMVTGSCHCVEINGKRILVDCGLQQGRDEMNNEQLPFPAKDVDYVLVTHAHIDHSGRLPLLVKQGFQGEILTTRLTARLLEIMLTDAAHIQESEAEYMNRKGERAGRERVEPLYTVADAQATLPYLRSCEYRQTVELCEGVSVVFTDAGHLLGSASITMTLSEGGVTKTVVFSGDIGNESQPILCDPDPLTKADYVLMESTYGNRNHEGEWNYEGRLAEIIDSTLSSGGNVIIPSFAVGRAQELLYFIRRIKDWGLVKSVPDFPVYIDSPLAEAATTIFCGDVHGYVDEDALEMSTDEKRMLTFSNLHMVKSGEDSRQLNDDPTPKVIISASGMCDAGRIRHHLKHNLWRYNSTIVFVGYQVPGTLGRKLIDGAESVKLFGEDIAVRAKIVNFKGLSAHADHDHLVSWVQSFDPKPARVFVVHGDEDVAPAFAEELKSLGFIAEAPMYTACFELGRGEMVEQGFMPERQRKSEARSRADVIYTRLVAAAEELLRFVKGARGMTNKDMASFTSQITALLDKWK